MNYSSTELIHTSAQGEIWLCTDSDGSRVIQRRYPYSKALHEMYMRLSAVKSAHIPEIYSVAHSGDHIEITEEYIVGSTFSQLMKIGRKFTEKEIKAAALFLCEALECLHQNGIIHRDIKPANIMLTNGGRIVLLDFSAARFYDGKREQDTRLLGTGGYAAPEQYGFSETDFRADIYALGVTLKELCGDKPASLKRAISGCTEFDPKKRYSSVKNLRKDIEHPYRREITAAVCSAAAVLAMVMLFVFVDVPQLVSDITGKTIHDNDAVSPVIVEYRLDEEAEYYTDGEGEIEFDYSEPLVSDYGIWSIHPDAQFVTYCMPNSSLCFRITKDTKAIVDNLSIEFVMRDIMLYSLGYSEGNIRLTNHINGIGMYAGAVWECDGTLTEEQFIFDFKQAAVYGDNPHIEVIVSADGFEDKVFDIPVKKSENYIYPANGEY